MFRRKASADPFPDMPFCAIDRNGDKYTTAVAASEDDWWCGATIIVNERHAERLRRELGPFAEVNPHTGEPLIEPTERQT